MTYSVTSNLHNPIRLESPLDIELLVCGKPESSLIDVVTAFSSKLLLLTNWCDDDWFCNPFDAYDSVLDNFINKLLLPNDMAPNDNDDDDDDVLLQSKWSLIRVACDSIINV